MWRLCKIEWNIKGNKRSDFVAVARTFAVLIEVYSFFGGGLSIEIIINGFSAFFTLLSMDDKSMVRMSEMKFTHIVRLPLKLSKCSIFDVMDTHTLTHTRARALNFAIWRCHRFVGRYSCDFYIYWFGSLYWIQTTILRNGIHFWNAYSKTVGNLSIHSANFGHYYDLASTLISLWSFSMGNTLSYRVFLLLEDCHSNCICVRVEFMLRKRFPAIFICHKYIVSKHRQLEYQCQCIVPLFFGSWSLLIWRLLFLTLVFVRNTLPTSNSSRKQIVNNSLRMLFDENGVPIHVRVCAKIQSKRGDKDYRNRTKEWTKKKT